MDSEDFKKSMTIAVIKVLYDIKNSNKSLKVDEEDFVPNEKGEIPRLEKNTNLYLKHMMLKKKKKKIIEVRNLVKSFKMVKLVK